MLSIKNKVHEYLQERALHKALVKLIGKVGSYEIEDDMIYIRFDKDELRTLGVLEFSLPSWEEVKIMAEQVYKKFDKKNIKKIVYVFDRFGRYDFSADFSSVKELILDAKNSDIHVFSSYFESINIKNASKVKFYNSGLRCHNCSIDINAETIVVENNIGADKINLNSEYIEFLNGSSCSNEINIVSKLIAFSNFSVYSKNIYLESEMIDSEFTNLKAENRIEINNKNCDPISGVHAKEIIYNGQDITYSDGIIIPKLEENLIEIFKKIKNKTNCFKRYRIAISKRKIQKTIK